MTSGISLINAKLDYALRAVIDLAMQPPSIAIQSREIAARQKIPGAYLDQILADLKRSGIVRSVRGAGGGYLLNKPAHTLAVGEIVRAFVGEQFFEREDENVNEYEAHAAPIVRQFRERLESNVAELLNGTTIADLISMKNRYDDAHSMMPHM